MHYLVVDHADAAGSDGSHGKLRLPWGAKLADDEDIEGRAKRLRDLVCNGNSAAREGEDDDLATCALLPDEFA
jgi:hypothetical protein